MFDLPDAKRVRRSELYSRETDEDDATSEGEVDAAIEAQLKERLVGIYGDFDLDLDVRPQPTESVPLDEGEAVNEGEAEQGFEFRLFSGQGDTGKKIVLSNEEEYIGNGAFVVGQRKRGYYIVEKADGERKKEFEKAALSGEDVLRKQRSRAWGLEVPWRVKVIKVSSKREANTVDGREQGNLGFGIEEGDEEGKRKKPGKKRRIVLRERKKKRDTLTAQRKKEKDAKEEAEREKRTRRNREKKVKRKLKEKAKKAEEGANTIMDDGKSSAERIVSG